MKKFIIALSIILNLALIHTGEAQAEHLESECGEEHNPELEAEIKQLRDELLNKDKPKTVKIYKIIKKVPYVNNKKFHDQIRKIKKNKNNSVVIR